MQGCVPWAPTPGCRLGAAAGTLPGVSPDAGSWLLAVAPVALLVVLVLRGRWSTTVNASAALTSAALLGILAFGGTPKGILVGLGKGLWTGLWILCVVWSALFLHAATRRMGLDRLGGPLTAILPRPTENVLVIGWIFPSFVQGVAGFGTPIAVAAPLLVTMGVRPVLAVALPLVGYHWAVGFGSVGSSFYMGAFTASLRPDETAAYASATSLLLGINAVLSGALVALMYAGRRGLREGWRLLLLAGPAMALTQALVVRFEPGVGALAGGAAGLLAAAVLSVTSRRRARMPAIEVVPVTRAPAADGPGTPHRADLPSRADPAAFHRLALVLLPYLLLLLGVLGVLLPAASRAWARSTLAWGPSFPETVTGRGAVAPAVSDYQPIALFGHPGSFIVFATFASILLWRLGRRWPAGGLRGIVSPWLRAARKASPSVLLLASVATVMADTGMVRTVAVGVADATGPAYPALAGAIGALGSFTTGSTTSSNALFSGLQADVARLIGVPPSELLAGQISGGNVGNSVAPVVVLLGATAVGIRERMPEVLRAVLVPAAVLLLSVVTGTSVLAALE